MYRTWGASKTAMEGIERVVSLFRSKKLRVQFHASLCFRLRLAEFHAIPTQDNPPWHKRPSLAKNMHALHVEAVGDPEWPSVVTVLARSKVLRHVSIQNTALTNKALKKLQCALSVRYLPLALFCFVFVACVCVCASVLLISKGGKKRNRNT